MNLAIIYGNIAGVVISLKNGAANPPARRIFTTTSCFQPLHPVAIKFAGIGMKRLLVKPPLRNFWLEPTSRKDVKLYFLGLQGLPSQQTHTSTM